MALTTIPASLSATALTLTTAAQPNITSVGTLTALTVDNIGINGDTITLTGTSATGFIQTSGGTVQMGSSTSDSLILYTDNTAALTIDTSQNATFAGTISGTLATAAQTNITSVGTLTSLSVGAITSSGAASGRYTGLEVVNTTSAAGTEVAVGLGVISAGNTACDVHLVADRVAANAGSDFYIEQSDASGNAQETFRITEAGNVGIGGTPTSLLDVKGSTGNSVITLNSAAAIDSYPSIGKLRFYSNDNSTNSSGEVGSVEVIGIGTWNGAANNAAMTFNLIQGLAGTTSPQEAMRINASGNVGIGTASPNSYSGYTALTINGTSGGLLDLELNGTLVGEVYSDSSHGIGLQAVGTRAIQFKTNNTQRARFDATTGNLIVGSTTTDLNILNGTPIVQIGNGNNHASLNFYSGTSSVGAIYFGDASSGTGRYDGYIEYRHNVPEMAFLVNGSAHTTMKSDGDLRIIDGDLKFGAGHGVSFINAADTATGETVSSSVLDDYEEGTFGVSLTRDGASSNATITIGTAHYVKIGRMVNITFYISAISNFPTDGTLAIIQTLPFNATNWHAGSIGYGLASNCSDTTWVCNGTKGYFLNSNQNGFKSGTIDLNRGMFSMTYQTT